MAVVIEGDREVFNVLAFGGIRPEIQHYVQQTQQYFQNNLTDVGRQSVNTMNQAFATMSHSDAIAIAKQAIYRTDFILQANFIHRLDTIEHVRKAPAVMIPYILSHPYLAKLQRDNRIDGYGEITEWKTPVYTHSMENPLIESVYNGWLIVNGKVDHYGLPCEHLDEGEEGEYVIFSPLTEEDSVEVPNLSLEEQLDIQATYQVVNQAIKEDEDPTSIYGGGIS